MDELKATLSKPPLLPIQFDEFCDILGGQTWQDFITQISNSQQQNRIKSLSKLKPFMLGSHRYLYSEKDHYRLGLEKLYLKLAVVGQLCRLVRNSHRLLQRMIGVINPYTVRVGLASANTLVPAYWNHKMAFGDTDELPFLKKLKVDAYTRPWKTRNTNDPRVDLYSLGMMLFRAILVDSEQKFNKIQPVILQLIDILHVEFPKNSSATIERNLLLRLNQLISDEILLPLKISITANTDFKKFVNQADWMKILMIGFRLVTKIPGFSYGELSRYQDENNWNVTEEVLNDIEKVTDEIKQSMLVEPIEMNADLATIVSELVTDSTWVAELCGDINNTNSIHKHINILSENDIKNELKINDGTRSVHQQVTTLDDTSLSKEKIDVHGGGLSDRNREKFIYHRIKEAGVLHDPLSNTALNLEKTMIQKSKTQSASRVGSIVTKSLVSRHNLSLYNAPVGGYEIDDETDKLQETLIQKPK